jgi:putative ABC transport system permease protein
MIKNYLKIAFRNLYRQKGFSFINISGLAIGMASAILIFMWAYNEISYDRFHDNKDQIYQAWNRGQFDGKLQCWSSTPEVLAPALQTEYPEVVNSCRVNTSWYVTKAGDKKLSAKAIIVDSTFLSMFSFPLVEGNRKTALNDASSIVVTQKMAVKMFGSEDVMNKVITIDGENLSVTGVLKDLPSNTQFDFEYILPWAYYKKKGIGSDSWGNNWVTSFVQLKKGTAIDQLNAKIKDITIRHSNRLEEHEVFLHPLTMAHLYSKFENGKVAGGRITVVRLFSSIGIFILLIACINFMNLSTARSEKRAKEVGIRKVAGANKGLLIGQFIGESILIAFIAGLLAFGLVYLSLGSFNQLIGQQLHIPYEMVSFWVMAVLFVLLTGTIAGSYPAFFLSSFKPIAVLKGTFKKAHAAVNPRKVLVVLQFSFAIILIISTLIVVQQIRHAQNRDAGYDRDQVFYHWTTGALQKNFSSFKNEVIASGVGTSVTRTSSPLSFGMSSTWGLEWRGKNQANKIEFDRFAQDEGIVSTAGLQIMQGRDMDLTKFPTDSTAMLINESAAKVMGFENPVGELVKDGDIEYHIVGVFKDFLLSSPYDLLRPMAIEGIKSEFINVVHVKLNGQKDMAENLAAMEKIFKKFNPDYPFEYHFVDVDYALKFDETQRTATLSGLFAGLTILISCLGLFGLAAYMAENRIKEIGVRKVLGATVFNITKLLSKDFLVLVGIAILIASPVAWYIMHEWLQSYSYRITIQWWVFGVAGLGAVTIALLTVSFQAIKAAIANPVKSLRTE